MFKNMKLWKKLALSFSVLIVFMLGLIGYFFFSLNGISHDLDRIVNVNNKRAEAANTMIDMVRETVMAMRNILLIKDMNEKKKLLDRIEKEYKPTYYEKLKLIESLTPSNDAKAWEIIKKVKAAGEKGFSLNDKVIQLSLSGKNDEAIDFMLKEAREPIRQWITDTNELIAYQEERNKLRFEEAVNIINQSKLLSIGIGMICTVLSIFIALFLTKSITQPINEIVEKLAKVAQGDLTIDIKVNRKDEMGILMNSLKDSIESIKRLIAESKTISSSLASSSEELSATTEEISRNLKSQTERASQIASAAEEMSQTVVDIAKNASNIAEVSVTTASVAKEGKDMTMNTAQEIKVIEGAIGKLSEVINVLGDRSRQIGEIVTVIKDIADQTNLLALNAAIEAARAGEQGRGFAVVADEVRKLAERTTKATDEIAEMIRGIQTEVDVAEGSMEDATKKVASGVELSNKSAEILGQILSKAQELQSMIQQIASATEEMSSVTDHITQDIGSIAEGSKEISLAVDQSAQTASDIARLGGELKIAIDKFKV
ncbi:methyl-accepting chemotaxis protein [Thermodesulfovibrio yellowstonii]|uniref:methyl-accepting chemotaxis protein n=3 Tax=Thermodesulfovibrio yellowstonii TaxID=28262 RepID=UPI003C7C60F1